MPFKRACECVLGLTIPIEWGASISHEQIKGIVERAASESCAKCKVAEKRPLHTTLSVTLTLENEAAELIEALAEQLGVSAGNAAEQAVKVGADLLRRNAA
jgi:hypothetical protein